MIRPASKLRIAIERWLARKFIVRYGPVMYQSRDSWVFVDYYGTRWRLVPSMDPSTPLQIHCESKE